MLDFELGEEISVAAHQGDVVGVELAVDPVAPLEAKRDEGPDFAKDEATKVGEGAVGHWLAIYVSEDIACTDSSLPVCRAAFDNCFNDNSSGIPVQC